MEPFRLPGGLVFLGGLRMPDKAEVLTPTESRQASPRRLNFRVLVASMLMAVVVAAVLYAFVYGYPESNIGVPETPSPAAPPSPSTPAPTTTP
jgi:hypothetical protein